jgi:small-conductance mechanosensitive channel
VALVDLSVSGLLPRLVLSLGIVVAAVGIVWLLGRLSADDDDLMTPAVLDALRLVGAVLALGAGALMLVDLWGLAGPLQTAIDRVAPGDTWVPRVLLTGAVAVGVWVSTRTVRRFLNRAVQDYRAVDQHRREVLYRVTQVSVYVLGAVVVLGLWRIDLGGLLVGAGVAGIVIGLAARQTLGAVIAGFVLMFSRPFQIGDWVAIGDTEGIVTGITIVNTRLQTVDAELAVVPNDEVSSRVITNYSHRGRLRVRVPVSLDYDTDLDEAAAVAREAMEGVEDVMEAPAPAAVLTTFGDSGIGLECRFWIRNPSPRKRWRTQTAAMEAIKTAYDEAGITIPFPQRTIGARGADVRVDAPEPSAEPPHGADDR